MKDFCFVAQPFDHGKFDQRYHDVIKPVIESLGLNAYRVDEDFEVVIPIDTIESKIPPALTISNFHRQCFFDARVTYLLIVFT